MEQPIEEDHAERELARRIQTGTPEQMAALLLEGSQKFLNLALLAMQNTDPTALIHNTQRVSAFIHELRRQINHDQGGDLATNLSRVYDWWDTEISQGSQNEQPDRLRAVFAQMGEIRITWEDLHLRKSKTIPD